MLLGILSDTHDELARTVRAVALLREHGASALVHCGDLVGPDVLAACGVLPGWFVFGNNDGDMIPHLRRTAADTGLVCLDWGGVFELAGKRIGVTHGHMSTDMRRVLAGNPDYLLSGHTHYAVDHIPDGVRRINPGALHRADEYTVAVLEVETGLVRFLAV